MNYKIAIPSKGRPELLLKKTYEKIIDQYNLNYNDIYIFVSSKDDLKLYNDTIPKNKYFKIILGPKGLTETFNYIGEYFKEGQPILLLQDDVTAFYELSKDKKLVRVKNLKLIINRVFSALYKTGLSLGGFYPVANETWMDKAKEVTTNLCFIFDPVRCFINRKNVKLTLTFNGTRSTKQDIENSILNYINDGGVLRFNKYSFETQYSPKKSNGGFGERTFDEELLVAKGIVEQYPLFADLKYSKKGQPNVRLVDKTLLKKNKNIIDRSVLPLKLVPEVTSDL
uniref:Glycosyltransferase n=1 Tax=viral metagenome TaxID=1070528 RepID=A0A6C0IVX8_9ZZZZ